MNIDRSKYYSNDKFGNMLFNITRCFNDMKIAKSLINSVNIGNFPSEKIKISYSLYVAKLYFAHLKECLKLLDIIRTKADFNHYFCNDDIRQEFKSIENELNVDDDSLNKKYLDIRNDVFHYAIIKGKDVLAFVEANNNLIKNGFNKIYIESSNGLYQYELASDVLTLTKYFNCQEIPEEITLLYDKSLKILQKILTNVCDIKSN